MYTYKKTVWKEDGTKYGAATFNNIEEGVYQANERLNEIEENGIKSVGYDRKETELLNAFMANLRTVPYNAEDKENTQLEICMMGDSVFYGYVDAKDPEAIQEDCHADNGPSWSVRFGDGKVFPVRNSVRIHDGLISALNAVYGSNKVKVKLKLYSGYCAKWAYTDYVATKSDLVIINYGINDAVGAWVEEGDGYLGNIVAYIQYMRGIVERELDNGTAVILMTPSRQTMMYSHDGETDNNPDDTNNRTLMDAYEQALKQLANEYGIPVIDGNEVTRNLDNSASYDFCHFDGFNNLSIGYRMASYFIGQSPMFPNSVYSGSYLGVNPAIDNMNVSGLAAISRSTNSPNLAIIMANVNLTYPVPDPDWQTKGVQVTVQGNGTVTWSFYAPFDGMVVVPCVYTETQNQGISLQLDFGGAQGRWNNYWYHMGTTVDRSYDEPTVVDIPSDYFVSQGAGKAYGLHMLDSEDKPVLYITSKGWHTVSIMMPQVMTLSVPEGNVGDGTFDVFGLHFLSVQDYNNLIAIKKLQSAQG